MAKAKRAAVYLRVSRGEQSLDNQRPDVRRLARARKLKVVTTFEENVSATRARPEFKSMMDAAHRGDFDASPSSGSARARALAQHA